MSGGGISNLSVMALNVSPYITASIIVQLWSNVSTKLHDLQHGMKDDQKHYETIMMRVAVIMALIQGAAMAYGYQKQGVLAHSEWYWILLVSVIWAIGTLLCALVGKRIQDHYRINGVSLILLCNIIASYPSGIKELYHTFIKGFSLTRQIASVLIIVFVVFFLFLFTYMVQESEKTLAVHYAGKGFSLNQTSQSSKFPIKLCPGGVVPVIFASTIMAIPSLAAGFFVSSDALWIKILTSSYWFHLDDLLPTIGVIPYILLIFAFSYFYANMSINPRELSENLKKSGGTIPGIRPGVPTEAYIRHQMRGVVSIGAAALTLIALIPIVLSGLFGLSKISFLGTSIIITVGVFSELAKTLSASGQSKKYLSTTKKKGGLF